MILTKVFDHLKRYPPASLDPRSREILAGELEAWLEDHKRVVRKIRDTKARQDFEDYFQEDVENVQHHLKLLAGVKL